MEIREVTTYNEKAPFAGYGVWIVFEMRQRKAHLLNPIYLTELILSEYEYVKSSGNCLWPINTTGTSFNFERFKVSFKERVAHFIDHKKPFPVQLVSRVIAELDGISTEKALKSIGEMGNRDKSAPRVIEKTGIEYGLRKGVDISNVRGRPLVIVTALSENGPASIYQITELVNGKLKTKSGLGRVVTYFVHKLTSQGILEIAN